VSGANGSVKPYQYWLVTFDGKRMRKRRRDIEMSQGHLSYRSRVSLGTIQRLEQLPAATSHRTTLHRLARVLSPDPDAFISELTAGFAAPAEPAPASPPPAKSRPDPWWLKAKPFPSARTGHSRYDIATARELLAMTGEFPNTKGGMLILLTEYRHALRDIAAGSPGKPG